MPDGQTKVVEVPGVGNVEFPASMADADIGAAIQKHLLSDESYQAAHPPSAGHPEVIDRAKPSYAAMGLANSPSGADPHNPGNPNLNAVPESERDNINSNLAATQGFALSAGPFAEAAALRSVKPLIPLAKTVVGSTAGHYLGREAGQALSPVFGPKAPQYGAEAGGLIGGLYGMTGKSLPTKKDVLNLFKSDAELQNEAYMAKGKDMIDAMKQQPEPFGMTKKGGLQIARPPAPEPELGSPDNPGFMSKLPARLPKSLRGDPFSPHVEDVAEAGRQAEAASGVSVVPEPRATLPGDRPGSAWSLTRTEGLPEAAQRGQPGALDVMRQLKPTIVTPRSGGFETPNMQALRDSLGISDAYSPNAPEIPQGNPTPFEPSVTQGWLKPRKQLVLQ